MKQIELYLSSIAIVISFSALSLSYWQFADGREHNRKSIQPMLVITPYLEGSGGRNGVYLSNPGLGPAILKDFTVTSNGITYGGLGKSHWKEVLRKLGLEPDCFKHGWPTERAIINVGEEEVLLAPTSANLAVCNLANTVLLTQKEMLLSVDYASLYGVGFRAEASAKINADFLDNGKP